MAQLLGMNFNYQGHYYIFTSPHDNELAAGKPYRHEISRKFDLVLVENGCFLEPTYVIIDGLPQEIEIPSMRAMYKINAEGVMVYKFKQYGQESSSTVHLIFDFKSRSQAANSFAD